MDAESFVGQPPRGGWVLYSVLRKANSTPMRNFFVSPPISQSRVLKKTLL